MSIVVPVAPFEPPAFRVLYADSFVGTIVVVGGSNVSQSGATWSLLSEPRPLEGITSGVELVSSGRRSLPETGKATFRTVYGDMSSEITFNPISLVGKEVRLQLQNLDGIWETVFWGHVDYEEDQVFPGAPAGTPAGARTYRCLDGFARTLKWPMNRSGFDPLDDASHNQVDVYGHPGYNYYLAADGPLIGNKSARVYTQDGVDINMFVWQGAFSVNFIASTYAWSDLSAVINAVSVTKPIGEPWFNFREGAANYGSISPLSVDPNDNVHNFVSRVCGRRRGLGTVALKFKDVAGGAYGQIQVWMGVTPLNPTSIGFTYIVGGAGGQVDGASAYVDWGNSRNLQYQTAQAGPLDLRGDNRNRDDVYFLGTQEGQQYDYIETIGENIEIAATFSLQDTTGGVANIYDIDSLQGLSPRWSASDRNTFEGLNINARVMDRWSHVYQAFGLPRWWNGKVGDGLGTAGKLSRIDVRCKDDGSIFQPGASFYKDTPGNLCEFLSYLPFYNAFDYSALLPVRTDNSPNNGMPDRRSAQVYLRPTATSEDRWFLPVGELPSNVVDKFFFKISLGNFSPTVMIQPDSIRILSQYFTEKGLRVFSSITRDASLVGYYKLGAAYDITQLAITAAIKLPYTLRFCSAPSIAEIETRLPLYPSVGFKDWQKARRKKTIKVPRAHLWLAHAACIWDLAQTSVTVEGYTALRSDVSPTPADGIKTIRDDRNRVQFYHMVAQYWYLNLRKRLQFTQTYCGLLPFKKMVAAVATTDYPVQINDHLETVYQNGDEDGAPTVVATNVTSVDYDHQAGTTTWGTDYFDLEFNV